MLTISALPGATTPRICGTEREEWRTAIHYHGTAARSRLADLAILGLGMGERIIENRDVGNIAVIDGGDGIITQPNLFNLSQRSLRMVRTSAGYQLKVGGNTYRPEDASAGQPLTGLGDDDAREVALPFAFPFYGAVHSKAFVHSDGNISFVHPDAESAARTLGRMVSGPPRIGPLFTDLDPSLAPDSVRVLARADTVTVTWLNVPVYQSAGVGARQTVQVRLSPNGDIEMSWSQVSAQTSVVGMAPGWQAGGTDVVALAGSDGLQYAGALAEPFQTSTTLDLVRAAQRFYETHDDAYDYLVFYNAAGIYPAPSALASALPVRSLTQGIGDTPVMTGDRYGSAYRLQAVLNMGPVTQYPEDPFAPVGLRGQVTGDNPLTILAHEAGHLFLALASARFADRPGEKPMLGAGLAHWSFNFNSEASFLEGNRIDDLGAGTAARFFTAGTVEQYSPLDQYLMGLRAPWEVPPMFLVDPSTQPAARLPQKNVRFSGSRRDVTVQDIIAAEGPRVPDHTVAQNRFRLGFVLLMPPGQEATAALISQIDTYRQEFDGFFNRTTGGRGWADTRLRNGLRMSAWPATGVVAGEAGRVALETQRPVSEDVVIGIHTTHGRLRAPLEVVIPRGQRSVEFELGGLAAGEDNLVAEARSGNFEPVFSRVMVFETRQALRLITHYVEGPIVLRVAAGSEVPVSNVPILVSAPGRIEFQPGFNTSFRTMGDGLMWFRWTPPAGGPSELTAEIEGRPDSRIVIKSQ